MEGLQESRAPRSLQADGARVLANGAGHQIAFGLDWVPMVGGNPHRLAVGRARALGATHFVLAGSQAVSLGFVRLARKAQCAGRRLHSAAALFAARNPEGAAGCLACIEPHGFWVVATHAGTVLAGTDRWFQDVESAHEALGTVRKRFPALRLQVEPGCVEGSLPQWLAGIPADPSRLQRVPASLFGIPAGARWVAGFALAGIAAYLVTDGSRGLNAERDVDADMQWREVVEGVARNHPIDSFAGLSAVIANWRSLPVNPSGWKLRQVHCEAGPAQWRCAAHYARLHRLALNAHLENFRPHGWSLQFTPLNDATFSWRVDRRASVLDWFTQAARPDWMSQLQRINPAFEHIQLGAGDAIALTPPADAGGQPLVRPSALADWAQRSLVLKGPLRSVPALRELAAPVRWRRVTLDVERAVPAAIAQSILSVHIVGDLYEPRP